MKKTDIAMIILIASLSVMITYALLSQIPLFKDVNKPVVVKIATPINPDFSSGGSSDKPVDTTIFNKSAINPTVKITIGESAPASQQGE